MYLVTLKNGQRAIYKGRKAENCIFVRLQGQPYWWWIPSAMVAQTIEIASNGMQDAA
ncbi:MAG: hypothetical protein P8I91_06055 [Phycisphaerales bacterium]|jgi:hypothetical protein|nr:hypothetical protein [Phycisphaerales bacterium]